MDSEGIVVLAIVDAVLVALFFLFRVLPWSKPGPWRLIWTTATLAASLFSLGELSAMIDGGSAIGFEVQAPLFAAILAMTVCFILVYMHGARIGEDARAQAVTDSLTQLLNSRGFDERVAAQLRRVEHFSLAYMGLDGVGIVNDVLGTHRGNALLRSFADLLREHAASTDGVARLGGDQFGLVLVGSDERAHEVVAAIQTGLRAYTLSQLAGIDVSVKCGVVSRTAATDPRRLIHLAYRAAHGIPFGEAEQPGAAP